MEHVFDVAERHIIEMEKELGALNLERAVGVMVLACLTKRGANDTVPNINAIIRGTPWRLTRQVQPHRQGRIRR